MPDEETLAILLAMTSGEHLPLAGVKDHLSEVVERLTREHGRVIITRHGKPAVAMLSVDDLESLEESLEILSDPKLMKAIRAADADVAAGRTVKLTKQQAKTLMKRR